MRLSSSRSFIVSIYNEFLFVVVNCNLGAQLGTLHSFYCLRNFVSIIPKLQLITYAYKRAYTYIFTHNYLYWYTGVHNHPCTRTLVHTTHTPTHTQTHKHTNTHAYTHNHVPGHTQAQTTLIQAVTLTYLL